MTKSIIVVTICYKLLCHSSRFLISNFLASTDINVFGRTYLFAMLLLIGLALFLHPGCFCLAFNLQRLVLKILFVIAYKGNILRNQSTSLLAATNCGKPFLRAGLDI